MTPVHKPYVWLVDPSLFTAPYDAALTKGLILAGAKVTWATRPLRQGDLQEIPAEYCAPFFYRWVEKLTFLPSPIWKLVKGIAHAWGLVRLYKNIVKTRPDVVHFQWLVIPVLDTLAIRLIQRVCPVVITVHDTTPFNGEKISAAQNTGFDIPLELANKLIVHTKSARQVLINRGIDSAKIEIIPHGPLSLSVPIPEISAEMRDVRTTFVLFGEIKPYKGMDILVEAVGKMSIDARKRSRFIIAGRPRMELVEIMARMDELGVMDSFDLRLKRLSEEEMANLFAEADCFLFPYRQIDASGVYFLVKGLGRYLIASRVGVFAEDLIEDEMNQLVEKEDVIGLSQALEKAVSKMSGVTPTCKAGGDWVSIGNLTINSYASCCERQ